MMTEGQERMMTVDGVNEDGFGARCCTNVETAIEEYPLATTVGVFAIGLTLGVAAGAALAAPLHLRRRRTAETLGRRVLETLQDYVPDSMNQYLRA